MVKVVYERQPTVYYINCNTCDAMLEYMEEDVCKRYSTDYSVFVSYVDCPRCGNEVITSESIDEMNRLSIHRLI